MIMVNLNDWCCTGIPCNTKDPTESIDRDLLYRDRAAATQHYVTGQTTTSTLNTAWKFQAKSDVNLFARFYQIHETIAVMLWYLNKTYAETVKTLPFQKCTARYFISMGKGNKRSATRSQPQKSLCHTWVAVVRSRECLLLTKQNTNREMTLVASIRLKRVDPDLFTDFRHFIIPTC